MDPGMWYDDDALLEGLTEAIARERTVPEHVLQAAKDTFDWREVDAELELLTLSFDSLLTEAVGVRGPAPDSPRMLVFDGEDLTIEIEVGQDVLMGQVVPARSERVILQCADGRVDEVTADEAGFFQLRRPTQGPIRLKWPNGEAAGAVTGWISI
jgi:hypothetical protein